MNQIAIASIIAVCLFIGMLVLLEVGRRLGNQQLAKDPDGARSGTGAIEGAVFGLLGLLIAFTFSGAATRFDARRDLIVKETNAIGTAWLRLDLLPVSVQPMIRESFRQYVDFRLEAYRKLPDVQAAQAELAKATALYQIPIRGSPLSGDNQLKFMEIRLQKDVISIGKWYYKAKSGPRQSLLGGWKACRRRRRCYCCQHSTK